MKQRIYILISITAFMLAYGCTEEIDLKLSNTHTRLVVEGIVTTDTTTHFVHLSLSGDYFLNEPLPSVSGATVSLSDGIKTSFLEESHDLPGYYLTMPDYYGVPGRTYSIKIDNVDINNDGIPETYTAESYLNPVTPVDSIRLEYEEDLDLWKVLLYADEPGGVTNYYMFSLIVNDTLYTDQLNEVTVADDRFIDGNYANGVWVHSIYEDDDSHVFQPGDTLTLRMSGIGKEYYKYVIALQDETRMHIPLFSGPPANLPGNISNGALGYFSAFSNSYGSTIFTGEK